MNQEKLDRRTFIKQSGSVIAGAAVGSTFFTKCSDNPASSNDSTNGNGDDAGFTIDLADSVNDVLNTVGGAKKFDVQELDDPLLVIRVSETEVSALSTTCTHAGCEVELPNNGVIMCNCHSSNFDLDGTVTRGPASSDLPSFPAVIEGTQIKVTL